MDLRPQAHDIIRTWLFSTVVRSHFEHDALPWRHAMISGWILDPDRKKMSKSAGNVVTPMPLLEAHGADALRYWAASGRPGADTAIDEAQMKVGRRLAIKVLNASKFVLGRLEGGPVPGPASVTEPLDVDLLCLLARPGQRGDGRLRRLRLHPRPRARPSPSSGPSATTTSSSSSCAPTARTTRSPRARPAPRWPTALSVLLRLLAPFLPFATEEAWRWWHEGSVHLAPWPRVEELGALDRSDAGRVYGPVTEVLEALRRAKSTAKVSPKRAASPRCDVVGPDAAREALRAARARPLRRPRVIAELHVRAGGALAVEVTLGEG